MSFWVSYNVGVLRQSDGPFTLWDSAKAEKRRLERERPDCHNIVIGTAPYDGLDDPAAEMEAETLAIENLRETQRAGERDIRGRVRE